MNKLFPSLLKGICSLVLISAIIGCGGGSGDDSNAKVAYAVQDQYTLSGQTVDLAKAVGAALKDKSIELGEDYASSKLTFTSVPAGAPADAISGVSIKNQYYEATGFAMAGSMNLFFNNLIWTGLIQPNVWVPPVIQTYEPLATLPSISWPVFTFSFPEPNFFIGSQSTAINIHIGPYSTSTDLPVTVSSTGSNTASLQIGNATLPVDKADPTPTGATGAK